MPPLVTSPALFDFSLFLMWPNGRESYPPAGTYLRYQLSVFSKVQSGLLEEDGGGEREGAQKLQPVPANEAAA